MRLAISESASLSTRNAQVTGLIGGLAAGGSRPKETRSFSVVCIWRRKVITTHALLQRVFIAASPSEDSKLVPARHRDRVHRVASIVRSDKMVTQVEASREGTTGKSRGRTRWEGTGRKEPHGKFPGGTTTSILRSRSLCHCQPPPPTPRQVRCLPRLRGSVRPPTTMAWPWRLGRISRDIVVTCETS